MLFSKAGFRELAEIKEINLKVKKSDNQRSTPEKSRCPYTSLIERYVEDSIREIQLSGKPAKAASLGKKGGSPNQSGSTCLFPCQKSEKTCLSDDEIWTGCINIMKISRGPFP